MYNTEDLEKISKYVHEEMWVPWAKILLSEENFSKDRVHRWTECFIPYEDQTEPMKDLDKVFAKGILDTINNKSNSYLNDRKAIDRLKREYNEHKNLIIGFDFDCTVFDYHMEGLELQPVIDLLKKCSDIGFTMCLHTLTPQENTFYKKVIELDKIGIRFSHINASPVMADQNNLYNNKPFYSILLDDRAGLSASYNILKTTIEELGL